MKQHLFKKNSSKGFTLIELMVTVTIMMVMTSVVVFNYNRFNESSLLNSFAYDLSLTIRQAQVYGTAVRESGTSQTESITVDSAKNFNSSYGVHFDASAAFPIILFIDGNGDGRYNEGDVVLQSYSFQRGVVISELSASSAALVSVVNNLDIVFKRPDPEAIINGNVDLSTAKIVLSNSDQTIKKSVVVYSTGQISVQ